MAINDANITIGLSPSLNQKEFEAVKSQFTSFLMNLKQAMYVEVNPKIKKELEEQYKIVEKIAIAYEQAFDSSSGQISVSKLNQEMKEANVSAQQFRQTMVGMKQEGASLYNNWAKSILNTNIQLKESNKLLDRMATTFKNTVRYGISSSAYNTMANAIQKAYNYTKNLDTSLNDIRIVSGQSAEQMDKLAVNANKAAQALGKTTLDYTKAATIYYQQGLSTDEVEARTEATLKAANVTGQSAQEVSEQLTAVWNGYKVANDELELYVDKLAAVAAHSASNLEELSTGMSKVASAANVMGVDIDQLTAQMSTIISVTRQAPESVGTALRTIYARIADIKAGLDDETSLGNYSGKMAQLGFNVLDASGNLKDMGDVIEEIGKKWTDLDREQQVALARTMAGTRQYNNLLTLFDNWDKYQEALEIAGDAAGTLNEQQEIYMQSTEAHLQQLQAEAEKTYSVLFDQEQARDFIDLVTNGLSVINKYLNGLNTGALGGILGQLGTIGANLFSNQIASGLSQNLNNRRIEAQNKQAFATKNVIMSAEEIVEDDSDKYDSANMANRNAFKRASQLNNIKGSLDPEKYKEIAESVQKINQFEAEHLKELNTYKEFQDELAVKEKELEAAITEQNDLLIKAKTSKEDLTEEEKQQLATLKEKINALREEEAALAQLGEAGKPDGYDDYNQRQAAYEATIKQADEQKRINTIIKATTTLLGTWNNVMAGINIITDENATTWEKVQGLIGVVATEGVLLLQGYSALQAVLPAVTAQVLGLATAEEAENLIKAKGVKWTLAAIAAKIKDVIITKGANIVIAISTLLLGKETAERVKNTAATNAQAVAVALLKAVSMDFTSVLILSVAAIAAATVGIYAWVSSVMDAADSHKKLAKELEDAQDNLQKTRDNYEDIKSTLSNYSSALDGIHSLTEGTLEFYDAILKVNEQAEKLIDQFGLIAGKDYTFDKNGMIRISEGTQEKLLYQEQQKVYRSQDTVSSIKKKQADLALDDLYAEFNKKLSEREQISYRLLNDKQTQALFEGKGFDEVSGRSWDGYSYLGNYKNAGGDINDLMAEYFAKYKAAKAEQENYFNLTQANRIRGYGSEQDVKTYNSMSNIGQTIFNKALEMEDRQTRNVKKQTVNGVSDYENMSFWDNPFGFSQFMSKTLSPLFTKNEEQNKINGQGMQYFRENYAKDNGYAQVNGKWYKNGKEVQLKDEISNEDAVEYYNNTKAVDTAKNVENLTKKYNAAYKQAQNNGFDEVSSKNIAANALAVQSGGMGGFDASVLDTKDREELIRYLKEDIKVSNDTLNAVQVTMDATVYDPTKKAVEELQIYNQILADQAAQIGTTQSALEAYADAMRNANAVGEDLNEENAEIIANAFKFNKVYNESIKVYKDSKDALNSYVKALKKTEVPSVEAAEAAGEMRDQLKQIGLNIKSIDLKDDNTFKNVQKLFEGTEEEAKKAYKELEKISLENSIANPLKTAIANATDPAAIESLSTFKNELSNFVNDISNLNPGDTIDEKWSTALINMVNNAHMTQEEVESLFQGMNLTIPTPVVPETDTSNVKTPEVDTQTVPGNATRHHAKGWYPDPTNPKEKIEIDYYWDEWTDDSEVSYVKYDPNQKLKYTGGGKGSGSFAKNPSNTKSKSGSSSKPSKKDPNKDELDRYRLVNVQLKEISKQLSALDKQKKKLLGGNLVANLNKQVDLLNRQIEVTEAKLKIAQDEQTEVAKKLAGYGAKFDSDGNISNYEQIFKQQQNKLNAVYAHYNSLSKEGQESYESVVKTAEETWKTFKESITKYDNLIGETIPQLYQDLQDAYDKQTENLIEQFNMEIKLRIDTAEAMRDWNDFKRKVIDGIKDDDILGTARAKLKDFTSYYNEDETGQIQKLTERVQQQLEEIRKQEEENGGEWYRDNNAQAFEDLKEYYEKLKDGLLDIVALEEEMHQKLMDSMDEAQDKFDEQLDTFENINKSLDHNIELINLLTDQDDYEKLAEQYAAQTKNRQEELDFYTKQKDFWEGYLKTLTEGTEEWENAKEKYNAAAEAWQSALTTTIQAARTEFENNINMIFKAINNQLTNNKGLDYLNTEWELLGANSELVLDNINRMQGFQDLTKKYNDAINSTSNISAQKKLAELRDSELESLKAMGNLSEQDLVRAEKKLDIVKAQIALEDAQRNKSQMRLRRDSQGNYRYQFVADEEEIQQAQQNLYAAYNELYNFDKSRYISNLNDAAQAWQEYQEKMAEAALINDPERRAEQEALIKEKYDEKIGILHEQLQRVMQDLNQSTFAELNALYGQNEENYELMTDQQRQALANFEDANQEAFKLIFNLSDKFGEMTQDQIDAIQNEMVPQWKSGYQDLVDEITREGGIEEVSQRMMDEIIAATEAYKAALAETEVQAGTTFEAASSAQNPIIENNKQLLQQNEELITQYQKMIDEIKALYYGDDETNGLVKMMEEFKAAADAAKQAAQDAYDKIVAMNNAQAEAAKKNTNEGSKADNEPKTSPTEPVVPQPSKASSSGPEVGKTVTFKSGKYTANSYGSGSSGSLYLGQQVKITRIVKDANGNVDANRARPIHIASVNGGDLGWVALSQISGYASGGYTGEWGNSGRLAMLHQKELVLNKEDTANMLNAVEVLRSITDRIGTDLLGRMASMTAGGFSSVVGGNAIDQNVHIEATFPGVQNAVEIETALNNLVNMAAQKAMQR